MERTVKDMVGAKIQSFKEVCDYFQIVTDKGTINIYNPSKYCTPQGNHLDMKDVKEEDLINAIVTNVIFETENYLKFELNKEKILKISLEGEEYMGPEALSIHYNAGEIIVFE